MPFETFVTMVMSGTGLALLLLILSTETNLRWLGEIHFPRLRGYRPFAPNWLTLLGLHITLIGFWVHIAHSPILGFLVAVFGAVLDRIDGKMAFTFGDPPGEKPHGWAALNSPHRTPLGEWLDPLADKIRFLSIAGYAALTSPHLNGWLVVAMAIPELIGIFNRPPFRKETKTEQGAVNATPIGKVKVTAQWTALLLWVGFHQGALEENAWVIHMLMGASIALGWGSNLSRRLQALPGSRLARVMEALSRAFRHDE